jgi:Ca2+-binding EF-hand superfamily protein
VKGKDSEELFMIVENMLHKLQNRMEEEVGNCQGIIDTLHHGRLNLGKGRKVDLSAQMMLSDDNAGRAPARPAEKVQPDMSPSPTQSPRIETLGATWPTERTKMRVDKSLTEQLNMDATTSTWATPVTRFAEEVNLKSSEPQPSSNGLPCENEVGGLATASASTSALVTYKQQATNASKDSGDEDWDHQEAKPREMSTMTIEQHRIAKMRSTEKINMTRRKSDYDVPAGITPWQERLVRIVNHRAVELLVGFCILANTISIGFQASWVVQNPSSPDIPGFGALDVLFTFVFTSELGLRMASEGRTFFKSINPNVKWNVFDFVVVGCALLEFLTSFLDAALPNMSGLRMLRTLRLMRIFRVIRVMRFFRDLRIMIAGIVTSMRPLLWAIVLLLVIMYMYGVLVLMVVGDELKMQAELGDRYKNDDVRMNVILGYFGDLELTIWTLSKAILMGIDWGQAADALNSLHWVLGYSFAIYVSFAVLCVMNIITGLFIDNATKNAQKDADIVWMEQQDARDKMNKEIEELFVLADIDHDGFVDYEEFEASITTWKMQSALQRLGVPVGTETAAGLFALLDFDNQGCIKIEDFGCILPQLNGQARSIDIAKLKHDTKRMGQRLNDLCEICERNFRILY